MGLGRFQQMSANLGQYHDLYMKTDVHLFADVFENDLCWDMYGLDAAQF